MFRFGYRVNLIVCQKSKIQDWCDHFDLYFDMWNNFNMVYDLTNKNSFEAFFNVVSDHGYTQTIIGIINYELAWRRKQLLQLSDFTLMLDESSLIQNPKAKQTKFILKLHPSHVILLSGTPVGGKYENLWSQCHLLGWGITQHGFDNTYVNWTKINSAGVIHKIVNKDDPYKNIKRLKTKLRECGAVFLKTEEVMDLPDQIVTQVTVERSPEYNIFQKHKIVDVCGRELVGDSTLTKLLYSRQLCGQYSKNKLQAVKDLIQSTQDRLIIFYNFDAELEALKEICKDRPVSEINGHVKDLTAYETETNAATLCQYQSASKGLNLQKCNKIIYFTLPLSSEHFEQSKKRIHRIGQDQTCFYYVLICKNTVEEKILETLEKRKDYTDALFEEQDP